jgi:hypothetical protein
LLWLADCRRHLFFISLVWSWILYWKVVHVHAYVHNILKSCSAQSSSSEQKVNLI